MIGQMPCVRTGFVTRFLWGQQGRTEVHVFLSSTAIQANRPALASRETVHAKSKLQFPRRDGAEERHEMFQNSLDFRFLFRKLSDLSNIFPSKPVEYAKAKDSQNSEVLRETAIGTHQTHPNQCKYLHFYDTETEARKSYQIQHASKESAIQTSDSIF